jgi:predicted enzyme related to lactoylglutathione lyase
VLRFGRVTFACDDPARVGEFWAAALGYALESQPRGVLASDRRGDGPTLSFARLPKSPTIELPIHLDVNVPDRSAEVARLLDLGATLVATKMQTVGELEETWTVLRDPEGNGFCVQGPDPRRPHPYVGNVSFACAEPRALGTFWSDALGWPEQKDADSFLQMLRNARLDEREFDAYYAILAPDSRRPRLLFQRREKSRPEAYPIHLDLTADDREAELARLAARGATEIVTKSDGARTWTVLRDPEGNPFCVE